MAVLDFIHMDDIASEVPFPAGDSRVCLHHLELVWGSAGTRVCRLLRFQDGIMQRRRGGIGEERGPAQFAEKLDLPQGLKPNRK
jgi:hypothetical protein